MELTTLKDFKLGPYKFKNVPTYIFDDEFNVTSYPFLGGLIGNDLLRRFNVTINYPQSEIHLQPNNHYRDPFDYSYTGMGLFMQEGHVTVSDVMKDSPAEKAGLKEGDHIIGVGNDLSGNLQTYKQILQDSGRKVKLLYQRDGELNQTTLFIKSIR
jgi:predicted metalloprotease with PDZ domain